MNGAKPARFIGLPPLRLASTVQPVSGKGVAFGRCRPFCSRTGSAVCGSRTFHARTGSAICTMGAAAQADGCCSLQRGYISAADGCCHLRKGYIPAANRVLHFAKGVYFHGGWGAAVGKRGVSDFILLFTIHQAVDCKKYIFFLNILDLNSDRLS